MNIKDIAKMANVSIATVSRVLNNPEKVKPETREKINEIIYDMNYQRNDLARGLLQNFTKTIGVIIPDISNLFYPSIVKGVEDTMDEQNFNVFLCNTDKSITREKKYINTLLEKRVDGMIFLGTRPVEPEKNDHIKRICNKIPVLMINDTLADTELYSVSTDEVMGACKAVQYLLALGHRNIAYLSGDMHYTTYRYKQAGYEEALNHAGVPLDPGLIVEAGKSDAEDREAIIDLLKYKRPTAIFAASDFIAMKAMKAACEHGYRLPDDLSIVGYANLPFSQELSPALTTVHQFPYETGATAAKTIIKAITGQAIEQKKYILEPELLIRDSCSRLE